MTALNPYIGYEQATAVAKEALETGRGVRELVLAKGLLTEERLREVLHPDNLARPHAAARAAAAADGRAAVSPVSAADGCAAVSAVSVAGGAAPPREGPPPRALRGPPPRLGRPHRRLSHETRPGPAPSHGARPSQGPTVPGPGPRVRRAPSWSPHPRGTGGSCCQEQGPGPGVRGR